MIKWQEILSQNGLAWKNPRQLAATARITTLPELKKFLDAVHIRVCLARPYQAFRNYPLVESRELLPSFDNAMFEYKNLPGFSMVAFARQLNYFDEPFQYDIIHPLSADPSTCPLPKQVYNQNMQTFTSRLPRVHQDIFRAQFAGHDLGWLGHYPDTLTYLLNMDRAHVMSLNSEGAFYLSGIFGSFTNDIDQVLKRFGQHIGKFRPGDSELYARNRMFVYQFLMELYGFAIVSERRTSAAMFARRLTRRGENFLLRVLGQTDRTLTTYTSDPAWAPFPKVEKIALVKVEDDQEEALEAIDRAGFFFDKDHRVIILRVVYRQHRYNENNVRQDRALSVESQEVIHPLTGAVLTGLNIIRDASNMYLRLGDIVSGEYTGRTIYRRTEVVESTKTDEDRLKVLSSWLSKHQRRMIDYTDEFFAKVEHIVTGYLYDPERDTAFANLRKLHAEVCARFSYICQARRVRAFEELSRRTYHGERLTYLQALRLELELVRQLRFEIVNFFPPLVEKLLVYLDRILADRYLVRTYIKPPDGTTLTEAGKEIRKIYGALVAADEEFRTALRRRLARAALKGEYATGRSARHRRADPAGERHATILSGDFLRPVEEEEPGAGFSQPAVQEQVSATGSQALADGGREAGTAWFLSGPADEPPRRM